MTIIVHTQLGLNRCHTGIHMAFRFLKRENGTLHGLFGQRQVVCGVDDPPGMSKFVVVQTIVRISL